MAAPGATAATIEEKIIQSKTTSEASQSPRTKHRSRLSMHFLPPAMFNKTPTSRPPTITSTATSRKLRKTRSILDMSSIGEGDIPAGMAGPTFSVTGRGHSQSVTTVDIPRHTTTFNVIPPGHKKDIFAEMMDWHTPSISSQFSTFSFFTWADAKWSRSSYCASSIWTRHFIQFSFLETHCWSFTCSSPPLGNVTGYLGVFQGNPHPYPWKPAPAARGAGFCRYWCWPYSLSHVTMMSLACHRVTFKLNALQPTITMTQQHDSDNNNHGGHGGRIHDANNDNKTVSTTRQCPQQDISCSYFRASFAGPWQVIYGQSVTFNLVEVSCWIFFHFFTFFFSIADLVICSATLSVYLLPLTAFAISQFHCVHHPSRH
jgi:hypothetical protein